MIATWVFGLIGLMFLGFAFYVAIRWLRHPLHDTTHQQLTTIQESIQKLTDEVLNLVEEMRQDRNERNKQD